MQNVKDGIQIRVYKINKESVANFYQIISKKVEEIFRNSQVQFREYLRKLRLKENVAFLVWP